MGKYQAYPEYKDSGLEWFGDIPSGWDVWKWKHTLASPMTYGANEAALDDDVKNPRYIRITDMNSDGSLRDDTFKSLQPKAAKNYLLKDGDILVARTGATVGKSFLYKDKFGAACFAGYLIRARINQNIVEPEFIYWYLQSDQYWKYISSSQIQATLQNVSAEKYGDMAIAIPSKKQDRLGIANFLDHETAKINTLIEQQQHLIQLLKEKRQAVISHAVTKGLNPDAPMKDSGVEWLGEVPAHWDVKYIKHLSQVKRGASPRPIDDPKYFDDDGEYAWVRIADVSSAGMYLTSTTQRLSELGSSLSVKLDADQLFVSIAGTVGKPCLTISKACIHDGFVYFPSLSINNKFLYYIFEAGEAYLGLGKMGTQLNLNTDTVGGIKIGVPSNDEIDKIIEFIEISNKKFDCLIERAVKSVSLMQERRTALISAAVTGKIDVRNWQAQQQQ